MDNLTHTLAGLLLAEAAVQARSRHGEPSAPFRTAAYLSSAFVNNAPDLDFVYAGITERPFGYLLHHRGHSHTVPVGLAIGVPPGYVVAFAAACYGYYILPTYPSDLATIQFDRSGTTRIGKYVINHSFILPGLIGVFTSCVAGYLLASARGLI